MPLSKEDLLRIKVLELDQSILGIRYKDGTTGSGIENQIINGPPSWVIWSRALHIIEHIRDITNAFPNLSKQILSVFEDIKKGCRELMSLINKACGMKGSDKVLEPPFYGLGLQITEKIVKNYSSIKKDFRNSIPEFNKEYGDLII